MIQPELSPEEKEEEVKREQLRLFREAVIWFLSRRLEGAGNAQRDMVEMRLEREREKAKSLLYRAKGPGTTAPLGSEINTPDSTAPMGNGSVESKTALDMDKSSGEGWDGLNPEQLQIFEREQQDMLRHYNEELNKIKTAESSLLEISQLQSQLAMNLETQSAHIDQLVQDSYMTTENVGSGNKELKKASERPSTARTVFWATSTFCAAVVVWDLIF
jgi:syntaxin 18